ncbi:hypothetical protein AWJ26_gp23 (endogenous virus) [Sinorhizobium phage phiLM21]|uniref:hypothetical protein n=1 Tax=Sinorhizobium phage phiLM21 TaxID=1524882 RepID=UPI0004E5D60A|nr:hypothetical protein AWJ26_gp23 [Sinorhizobium phage phiLM21]AII27775.1 hypothetical protein phiLM21_p023 [Sinorhizobium phage phiLM21]
MAGDDRGSSPAVEPSCAAAALRKGMTWEGPAAAPTAPSSPSEVMPVRINVSLNETRDRTGTEKCTAKEFPKPENLFPRRR